MALVATLALSLAFAQAPAAHVHEHESTQGHSGSLFHTHVGHPSSQNSEFRDFDPDDDAHFQNWFQSTCFAPILPPVVLTQVSLEAELRITPGRPFETRASVHDPPDSDATPPRAPPV